jgi:glutamate-1-semialdehyde 2,1-aminomutase
MILGHSHPSVLSAIEAYSKQGQMFAGQHIKEIELAEKLNEIIPSAELLRFCLDGSEAVQTAFRVARAKTGKKKFIRFEGHYHGWLDNVAWGLSSPSLEALGDRTSPNIYPWSQGISAESKDEFIVLPWNDLALLEKIMSEMHHEIAAIITEPIMCNNGCILPAQGFLEGIRSICDKYNSAFILDEVITGFRISLGGAQQYFNIVPDISIFAKALGSGYPISAIVGKREWMSLIEESKVIHAGTMNSSNPTVAAALATISVLEQEQPYERMFMLGNKLMNGLRKAAALANQKVLVQGPGPMFILAFTELTSFKDYRDTFSSDKAKLAKFIAGMHNSKIRVIGRGLWYISAVHTEEEVDHAINIATEVFGNM